MRADRNGNETVRIYEPSNVYPTADLGENVQVGTFSEIGNNVKIGDNVRVGAHSFICECVIIEDSAWIGPRVTFCNDRFPPSPKDKWEWTLVKKGSRVGAGCVILPGVTIGEDALIGAGSTVTKDVPDGEVWAGNPACRIEKKG
jgi:UDP-2-acetamido-3-amino-2,3-dideoxy-glucuronate N-acetyltransferase